MPSIIGSVERHLRLREDVLGNPCLRSRKAKRGYHILKRIFQTKTFFESILGKSISTRKEAIKMIKINNNKKKLIEFGKKGNIRI